MKHRKMHYAWVILSSCCLFFFLSQGMILGTIGTYMTSIAESLNVGQTQVFWCKWCAVYTGTCCSCGNIWIRF